MEGTPMARLQNGQPSSQCMQGISAMGSEGARSVRSQNSQSLPQSMQGINSSRPFSSRSRMASLNSRLSSSRLRLASSCSTPQMQNSENSQQLTDEWQVVLKRELERPLFVCVLCSLNSYLILVQLAFVFILFLAAIENFLVQLLMDFFSTPEFRSAPRSRQEFASPLFFQ